MLGRIPSLTGNRGDLTSPPDISATRADDGIGELNAWIEAVTASGIPELNRFTSGLGGILCHGERTTAAAWQRTSVPPRQWFR